MTSAITEIERGDEENFSGARLIKLDSAEGAAVSQLRHGAPLFVQHFYEPCVKDVMRDLDPGCKERVRRFIVMGDSGSEYGAPYTAAPRPRPPLAHSLSPQ